MLGVQDAEEHRRGGGGGEDGRHHVRPGHTGTTQQRPIQQRAGGAGLDACQRRKQRDGGD